MEIKKLIKELESLKAPDNTYSFTCYGKEDILVMVLNVNPDKNGKFPCPKKDCTYAQEKQCGGEIQGVLKSNLSDQSWNWAINEMIDRIKIRYKIVDGDIWNG